MRNFFLANLAIKIERRIGFFFINSEKTIYVYALTDSTYMFEILKTKLFVKFMNMDIFYLSLR